MSITVTVGEKPENHPFYGQGSKLCYYINGAPGAHLELTVGQTYKFTIDAKGHPFYFTTSSIGGSEDKNSLSGWVPIDSGEAALTVPADWPTNFYYECKIHPYMGSSASHHSISMEIIMKNLVAPIAVTSPNEHEIYIADQIGIIYRILNNTVNTYLNINQKIPKLNPNYDERGLIGFAFHPNYVRNGLVYVFYSFADKNLPENKYYNYLSRFRYTYGEISYESEKILLKLEKDLPYHNGGKLGFGPDGYLYITIGDGGPQGSGAVKAQDLGSLFGKILRIDVNVEEAPYYRIPADNPFVNVPRARGEIWVLGLRNPWGLEFYNDILIVSDAGYESGSGQEEINIIIKGGNYGWNVKEGHYLASWSDPNADVSKMIDPIFSYTTSDRTYANSDISAIIGGYLTKEGDYICADFSGRIIRLRFHNEITEVIETASINKWIRGFGKIRDDIYILTSQNQGPKDKTGEVCRLKIF